MRKITNTDNRKAQDGVIPVLQEQLRLSTEQIDTASIKVKKEVSEKHIDLQTFLHTEDVEVRHVRIDRPIETPPPPVRTEGDTTIISVVREELVVQKRLVLEEEIHITKHTVRKPVEKPFVLRKEHIHITKEQPESAGGK